MTPTDLRTAIRSEVLADEPPFAMTSAVMLNAGNRAVRRRRILAATCGAALAAGAILGVGPLIAGNAPEQSAVPPPAQKVLDGFDPATFPATVDAEVRAAVGEAIPAGVVGRIEPTLDGYTRLRPKDYAYADSWTARYDLSPSDRLMVIMRHDQSANEGNARRYCQENLAAGEMQRCSAGTLADGSTTITSVYNMTLSRSGFVRVRDNDDPDSRWYARQVVTRRNYGFGVIAREYVAAPTLAQADRLWSVSVDQLTQVAASPRLVYRMPTGPKKKCDVTFLVPRNEDRYARVVCEGSLND